VLDAIDAANQSGKKIVYDDEEFDDQKSLANYLNVDASTVSRFIRDKDKILSDYNNLIQRAPSVPSQTKRVQACFHHYFAACVFSLSTLFFLPGTILS
jgi:hypothetical protein